MKKLSLKIIFLLAGTFCFSEPDLSGIDIPSSINKVNSGFNSFAEKVRNTAPLTMAGQNICAESCLESFLPEGHHFSAGLNFSVTKLDSSKLSSTFKTMSSLFKVIGHDINMSVPDMMPLPSVTFDGRIGGFKLPFDLGFAFTFFSPDAFGINPEDSSTFDGIESPVKFHRGDFDGKYTLFSFGLNGRYLIIKNKDKIPDISAGLGWYCSKGALNMETTDINENGTLEVHMGHSFFTQVISMESQASKTYGRFTPFAGLKVLWSSSQNGWVRKVYLDGTYMPMSGTNCLKRSFLDFYLQPQIFTGTVINAGPLQITVSAGFDVRNVNLSGALSVRYRK